MSMETYQLHQPPRSSVFDKNGKGVANEPLAVEGVGVPLQQS
jgi:hypothetical protein